MSTKKILVTGCSGFIGSSLVNHYKKLNMEVDGIDIKDKKSITVDNFYAYNGSQKELETIFENGYDICVNCAGSPSVKFSFEHPLEDYELNTEITFKFLAALKVKNPECKFFSLSSAAVYGNPEKLPVKEDAQVHPISPYGYHKHISEIICKQYRAYYGVRTFSLRLFSVYGPGLRKQIFWDLYKKSQKSNTVKVFGTGGETRDFIFIDDLVKAIELITLNDKLDAQVVNIANGNQVKISKAVEIFFQQLDKDISYEFTGDAKRGDPKHWEADISILASTGYKSEYSIEEGIRRYVSWIKLLK